MHKVDFHNFYKIAENGCWVWIRALNKKGYGNAWYNGKYWMAHRLSYYFYNGNIPDGLCVRHYCHNPACVNPKHLSVGTYQENTNDSVISGTVFGPTSKHSDELATKAYMLWRDGKTAFYIYKQTGIPTACVRSLGCGKYMPHIKRKIDLELGNYSRKVENFRLKDEDIINIRNLYSNNKPITEIAKLYNAKYKYIWKVVNNKLRPTITRGDI